MFFQQKFKRNAGFSLMELLVVLVILSVLMAGVFLTLMTGKDAWLTTSTKIQLGENLRTAMEKISLELRETGSDNLGVMQLTISNGTGVNNSDSIRFSIPVVCQANASIINSNGDVSYWRAPLTWGCQSSACMDADNDCSTVDYRYIEYQINANNQLVRRVLNNAGLLVRSDIFAVNISDFQITLSADQNIVTLTATATRKSEYNRVMTATRTLNVHLRNRG